jgi:hypothetical protein
MSGRHDPRPLTGGLTFGGVIDTSPYQQRLSGPRSLGEDPAYLAYLRGSQLEDSFDNADLITQRHRTTRDAGNMLSDNAFGTMQGRNAVFADAEDRGIVGSSVWARNRANVDRAGAINQRNIQTAAADRLADMENMVGRNVARRRRGLAEQGLQSGMNLFAYSQGG